MKWEFTDKKEEESVVKVLGLFVDDPELMVKKGYISINPEHFVEFMTALIPILENVDKMDELINSNVVKKGIHLMTGLPMEFGRISARETIENAIFRAYKHTNNML